MNQQQTNRKDYTVKKKMAPYTSLIMPENKVDMENVKKEIDKLDYLTGLEKVIQKTKEFYINNKDYGELLPEFIKSIKEMDEELGSIMENIVKKEEPVLYQKDSYFQQITLMGIITKMLLIIIEDAKLVEDKKALLDLLSLLRYDYLPLVWLEVAKKSFIPRLKEFRNYIVNYYENYYKE